MITAHQIKFPKFFQAQMDELMSQNTHSKPIWDDILLWSSTLGVILLLIFSIVVGMMYSDIKRQNQQLVEKLSFYKSFTDEWPRISTQGLGDDELNRIAVQLLLLMGENITTHYSEQIGNITVALRSSVVSGTSSVGRIYTFGYGRMSDGSMHIDYFVTDNTQMMKFFEVHIIPGGGYLEMYTEDGQFLRKVYP